MAASTDQRESRRGTVAFLVVLTALVTAMGMFVWLSPSHLNPKPDTDDCPRVLADDDLVRLALRSDEAAAKAQLDRWEGCAKAPTISEAEDAVGRDDVLAGLLAITLAAGAAFAWFWERWRAVAVIGAVSTGVYVVADVKENMLLRRFLDDPESWSELLPFAAAVKFGALAGAVPVFVVGVFVAVGDLFLKGPRRRRMADHEGEARSALQAAGRFTRRWVRRALTTDMPSQDVEPKGKAAADDREKKRTLGVSCSGGGIRSAAFNLGALQALEEEREMDEARFLSAVSGGSYQAAAWVTGRAPDGSAPDAWARSSSEEDHLRRNASYIAPGFGGKLWAITRFLFGFLLNLALVVLALGAVFLPVGWLVHTAEAPRPVADGSTVAVARGGDLVLADGRRVAAVRGSTLRVGGSGDDVRLDLTAPPRDEKRRPVCKDASGNVVGRVSEAAPAAIKGRCLSEGTRVRLDLSLPLPVEGTNILVSKLDEKRRPQPKVVRAEEGSRLVKAADAHLTLDDDAIVFGEVDKHGNLKEARLGKPCAGRVCEEFRAPGPLKYAAVAAVAATLLAGLALVGARALTETSKRTERWAKRLTLLTLIIVVLGLVLPQMVVWGERARWWLADASARQGVGAFAAVTAGLLAQLASFTAASSSDGGKKVRSWAQRLGRRLQPVLVRLAGAVAGPLLVVGIAVAFASYAAQETWGPGQVGLWLGLAGPLAVALAGADLNEWSLHPFYRDRLRSAFAVNPRTNPPSDPREDPLDELPAPPPTLLVCAAVNIADSRVTPPGRPVASWVFRRDRIGSEQMAAARSAVVTDETTGTFAPDQLPTHLKHLAWTWTAVAVSGAAFSPAMGKMTRPERFLFALGNLRLGVWYPNPRFLGDAAERSWYDRHYPRPWYLAKEALGLHRADDRWVYVTDGGHYENLGLVELLREGVREVYCFDASGDSPDTFGTIADAMRLARSELGVEIEIDPTPLKPENPDESIVSKVGVTAGTIVYPEVRSAAGTSAKVPEKERQGWIVLAKLSVPATAPFDVIDLARTLESFPNHPTADQLYTDQKFEAYRALGHHLGAEAAVLGAGIRKRVNRGSSVRNAVRKAIETRANLGP